MTDSATDQGEPEPQLPEKPSLGKTLIAVGIALAVVIIVFGWLLPSLGVDYGEVLDAIKTLTGSQMAILLVLRLGRIVLEGAALLPVVPGINLWQATVGRSTSTGVANVIPGPWDLPLRYSCYVSWESHLTMPCCRFPLAASSR